MSAPKRRSTRSPRGYAAAVVAVDRKLTGSAGEHYVCSVLAQIGWAASLTREGVAHADVLAVGADLDAGVPERPMIEVQVKTMRHHRKPMWPMGGGWIGAASSPREWYVFVLLGATARERPRCWVVPRDHATAGAWIAHMHWLTQPGVPAGKRNAPVLRSRVGLDVWAGYEERWDLLDKPANGAPLLLPDWITELVGEPRIAFPQWHPWHNAAPTRSAGD